MKEVFLNGRMNILILIIIILLSINLKIINAEKGATIVLNKNHEIEDYKDLIYKINKTSEIRVYVRIQDDSKIEIRGPKEEKSIFMKEKSNFIHKKIEKIIKNLHAGEYSNV